VASYNAAINIVVSGQQRLDYVLNSVERLNAITAKLKPINLLAPGAGAGGDAIRVAKKQLDDFARAVVNFQPQGIQRRAKELSTTLAGSAGQANALGTALANIGLKSGGFKQQTVEVKNYALALDTATRNAARLEVINRRVQREARIENIAKRFNTTPEAVQARITGISEAVGRRQPATTGTTRIGGQSRLGGAVSSALIGGGFPFLFGQGPAAAAGGALGGLAGGLLGGGFGFALSIVGTAIGDAVTKAEAFDKSLAALNTGLKTTGSTSITTASDVNKLAFSLNVTTEEAIDLLNTFKQFSDGNTREALAGLFGPVGGAATFEAIAKAGIDEKNALSAIFSLRKEIGNEAVIQLALQLKSVGAAATQSNLLKIILDRSIEISVAQASQVTFTDRLLSIWEGIIAGVAQALSLATRFIAKLQEGTLIKLPFLDQLAAVLGGVTGRTPEDIAEQRGQDLSKQLKAERDRIRRALAEETRAVTLENTLGESLKAGKKPPEDRTQQLTEELTAIIAIGQAEDKIRDLLFQGRDLLAAEVELEKQLADITRDRNKALIGANYESERIVINKIAEARIVDAQLRAEDKMREIRQRRFEEELQVKEAVRSSVRAFTDMRQEQELQVQFSKTYYRLLAEGVLPAEAERIANFDKLVSAQLNAVKLQIQITQAAILEAKARGLSTAKLQEELDLLKQKQEAITGEAVKGPGVAAAEATPGQKITEKIGKLKEEIAELTKIGNIAIKVADGIGAAFGQAFAGLISGSMSAREALSSFFKSVADMFLEMAAQIIAKQITMIILQTILRALGAVGGGGGGGGNAATALGSNPNVAAYAPLAKGGVFGNGVAAFANGGTFTNSIVSSPTLFPFADGGTTRTGLMGEAGPEAIMPLKRGADGSLGVQATGLREAMGRPPGSANGSPVLNMSFQSTTIGGVEYVSREQLEQAMAQTRQQASRDGAQRGMSMTLDRLQQSPSTRNRIGIR